MKQPQPEAPLPETPWQLSQAWQWIPNPLDETRGTIRARDGRSVLMNVATDLAGYFVGLHNASLRANAPVAMAKPQVLPAIDPVPLLPEEVTPLVEQLTPRQREIYLLIKGRSELTGITPTVREICEATGLRSSATVFFHLQKIEEQGLLRRPSPRSRRFILEGSGLRCPKCATFVRVLGSED